MTSTTTDRRIGLSGSDAIKTPCSAATTSAITLSGEQTVDGVSCVTGDRVLVKNQASSVDNGIYVCDTGTWTRDLDFDGPLDVTTGTLVSVQSGSANATTYWRLTTTGDITFGSSAITFASALASDSSFLSFLQAGTGVVARTAQAKLRELSLSLMDFTGADNTGTNDNTAALILCMNKAFASTTLTTNLVIDLPDGEYLFTQTNPFGQYVAGANARQHVTFRGNGRYSTRIRFKPGGSTDAYLYDGSTGSGTVAANDQLLFAMFHDIGFIMDETGMSGGTLNIVRQFPKSGAPNQNFQFRDCYALGPSTVARAGAWLVNRGTINASENSFYNCRASQMKTIIDSANGQSVNHYIFGCDWESMVGDIYLFNDGGGMLTHEGGSIIYGSTLVTDSYVFNLQASSGMGTVFNMIGVKTELNDTNALLLNVSGVNNAATVNWVGCDLSATGGTGSRIAVSVESRSPAQVFFDRCNLNPSTGPFLYEFKVGAAFYYLANQFNGTVTFKDCQLPLDIHSRFSWGANSNGLFRIRGGFSASTWNTTDPSIAWDCDLLPVGWVTAPSSPSTTLKSAGGLVYYWPDVSADTNGGSNRLKLPLNAMIKLVKVRKAAHGGSSASYRLAVTNDDGTFTYGISTAANQSVQHDIESTTWRQATSGVNQIVRVVTVKELAYNTQTANFTVGATLTDGTTATTAKILFDTDAGATGTLVLGFITGGTGLFGVGSIITDGSGGSATAGATTSRQGGGEFRTMAFGDVYAVEYY